MNAFEDTNSTSSPMTHSGGRYSTSSSIGKPSLIQSSTTSSKPRLAQVTNVFSRVAAKVKRSKKDKKNKKDKKDKKNKKHKKNRASNTHSKPSNHTNTIPSTSPNKQRQSESKETESNDKLAVFLRSKGYVIQSKLADTLQGAIYRCYVLNKVQYFGQNTVVIKVTRKDLHSQSMTILDNGKKKYIQENIMKERDIIEQLTYTQHAKTVYMTRYIDFFSNKSSLFLVMEDGGSDLFEYVVRCHNLIRKGKLERKEWRLICKKIFKQIIEFMDYIHTEHNICHLDISLENMLIQNGTIFQNTQNGRITLNRNITIKFCDFGLSEKFDEEEEFKCTKYVGKTRYKSPELWSKTLVFDARLNDIWSLGITLFMMIIGTPPLKYPDDKDHNFNLIISGKILELIQSWNRAKYMTPQILDLLAKMLRKEEERITLERIMSHSWVKLI